MIIDLQNNKSSLRKMKTKLKNVKLIDAVIKKEKLITHFHGEYRKTAFRDLKIQVSVIDIRKLKLILKKQT